MEENNISWLGLPDGETLGAGEDSTYGEPGGSVRSTQVPPEYPEPKVQARSQGRHGRPREAVAPVRVIPEETVGQPIREVFEGPDKRILSRDPETGLGYLRDRFQVVELVEEAEERVEQWLKAQRHILSAFYSHKQGHPLDYQLRASLVLETIRYEIDSHTFDPLKYVADDLKKFWTSTLLDKFLAKKLPNITPSYQKNYETFRGTRL